MKIPNYIVPIFQQGSWVNNSYANSINPAVLNQVLGTPRSQGYNEAAQNIQIQNSLANSRAQRENAEIARRIQRERLEMQRERNELVKTRQEIEFQKMYKDPNLGFNILPGNQEAFNKIAEEYNTVNLPDDVTGYGEFNNNVMQMARDPRIRKMQEKAVLFEKLDQDLESYRQMIRKAELKPDVFDVEVMRKNYQELSKSVSEFGKSSGEEGEDWMDQYYNLNSQIESVGLETQEHYKRAQELKNQIAEVELYDKQWDLQLKQHEQEQLEKAMEGMNELERLEFMKNYKSKRSSTKATGDSVEERQIAAIMRNHKERTGREMPYIDALRIYKTAGKPPEQASSYKYNGINIDKNLISNLEDVLEDDAVVVQQGNRLVINNASKNEVNEVLSTLGLPLLDESVDIENEGWRGNRKTTISIPLEEVNTSPWDMYSNYGSSTEQTSSLPAGTGTTEDGIPFNYTPNGDGTYNITDRNGTFIGIFDQDDLIQALNN